MRSRPIPLRQDSSVGLRFHAAVTPENDPNSPPGARSEKANAAEQARWDVMGDFYINQVGARSEKATTAEKARWDAMGKFYTNQASARSEKAITAEQARVHLEAMRKMMAGQSEDTPRKIHWESIRKRIESAVGRGDMTREEADAKYKEIKERTTDSRRR